MQVTFGEHKGSSNTDLQLSARKKKPGTVTSLRRKPNAYYIETLQK